MVGPDRRELIADAAIGIVAEEGVHALTHRAVDRRLGMPPGSTSFYARTRRALLEAAVTELARRSRRDFEQSGAHVPDPDAGAVPGVSEVAGIIAALLDATLCHRRRETVARYALALELAGDEPLRRALATGSFSRPLAAGLLAALGARDPEAAGADLVSLAEGLVFDRLVGQRSLEPVSPGTPESAGQLKSAIEAFLRGALRS